MLFRGELHLAAALDVRDLFDELDAGGFDEAIVDLRDVTFVDSTGMNIVSAGPKWGRETGHVVAFIRPSSEVLEKFEPAGLAEVFGFTDLSTSPARRSGPGTLPQVGCGADAMRSNRRVARRPPKLSTDRLDRRRASIADRKEEPHVR